MSSKITNIKSYNSIENKIPPRISPTNVEYKCPVDDLNIDHYRVLLDGDMETNNIYIQLGYNNDEEYDSGFFLSLEDAINLAQRIVDKTNETLESYKVLEEGKIFIEALEVSMISNIITEINIRPISMYINNPNDSLFGSIIMEVSYTTRDNKVYEARIISDPYKYKDLMKYENLENELKDKYDSIKHVVFDNNRFRELITKMKSINDEYMKSIEPEDNPVSEAKQSLEDIAHEVMRKMNEENK